MASTHIFFSLFLVFDLYEDEWWICPIPVPSHFYVGLTLFVPSLRSPENLNFIDFIKKARNNKRYTRIHKTYIKWRIVNLLFNPDCKIPTKKSVWCLFRWLFYEFFFLGVFFSFYSTENGMDRRRSTSKWFQKNRQLGTFKTSESCYKSIQS